MRYHKLGLFVLCSSLLAGCLNTSNPLFGPTANSVNKSVPTRTPATDSLSSDPTAFAQITDIPIPANARLNVNRSIILGDRDMWHGRAEIDTPYSSAEMYDFFKREMVTFGWTELSSVRSDESVITFIRGSRIGTAQIFGSNSLTTGSVVTLTVAPIGNTSVLSSGGLMSGPAVGGGQLGGNQPGGGTTFSR